jgi:hypothetical protein
MRRTKYGMRGTNRRWAATLLFWLAGGGFAFLLPSPAASQDQDDDDWSRWGKTTGDALVHFLPNAAPWGLSADPYPLFRAFGNETYDYKGADSMLREYPTYIVHQTWWFDDAELSREVAALEKEKEGQKQELEKAADDFYRIHGAEMKAFEKARLAEEDAWGKQLADLMRQGKYDEAQQMVKNGEKRGPLVYPPYLALTDSFNKRQNEIADRERVLANRRRKVSFQIHINRTPTTTAAALFPKPAGTLAGHPFYHQDRGNMKSGDWDVSIVDLAVFLAPRGYQNPRVKIGLRKLALKSIVVWAWIESHADTIKADEATARKVLESMDYDGLSKLIEP